jgi:hypothetical protein
MSPAPKLRLLARTEAPTRYADAGLMAGRLGNGSRLSAEKSPSSNISADPHARLFGLSLAALWAACLVLNAASQPTRICERSGRDFGTTTTGTNSISGSSRVAPTRGGGSHVEPFGTIRPKECATNEDREEPGY